MIKSTTKTKLIRNVPQPLWDRLRVQANKEGRLFHKFIIHLLEWAIGEREKDDNPKE